MPLTLLVEVEIEELSEFLRDKRVGAVRQRYWAEHQALSDHYLVTNLVTGGQDSFPSIEDAADAQRSLPVLRQPANDQSA